MRKEKGITLIALVITIIVLIIISGISISIITGENGIIRNTQKAAVENRGGAIEEIRDMWNAEKDTSRLTGGMIKVRELEEVIDELNGRRLLLEGEGDILRSTGKLTIGNRDIVFEEIDNQEKEEIEYGDWSSVYTSTKKDNYIDKDGVKATIPKDFQVSKTDGEDTVKDGLVIRGPDGSEFVWIPVPDINEMYDENNNAGQLYDFTSGGRSTKKEYPGPNTGLREPDIIKSLMCDGKSSNLLAAGLKDGSTAEQFKIQLQEEFEAMKNKVSTYGGFYIGRYETGNSSDTTVVSKKNNTDIYNQTWYVMYRKQKEMYSSSSSVVSSMIWGSQWDAMLRWLNEDESIGNYVTNSTGKGNYKESEMEYFDCDTNSMKTKPSGTSLIIPTGSSDITRVKNIYDVAGNVVEWTMEALSTDGRITRGGGYTGKGSSNSASLRSFSAPNDTVSQNSYLGSRLQLYIQ